MLAHSQIPWGEESEVKYFKTMNRIYGDIFGCECRLLKISELKSKNDEMSAKYEKEKKQILEIKNLKSQLDEAKGNVEKFEREYDLNKAAELKYSTLPNLKKLLEQEEKEIEGLISEGVPRRYIEERLDRARDIACEKGVTLRNLLRLWWHNDRGLWSPSASAPRQTAERDAKHRELEEWLEAMDRQLLGY